MLSIKWYACHPGTHPVEDPPEEHLLESSATGECVDAQSNTEVRVAESGTEEPTAVIAASEPNTRTSTAEANSQATHPSKTPKRKSGRACKPKKKPRLCDVVEQSNEQMRQIQDYMQNNSTTPEARSKEREEDREFFRHMFGMMSQTMMGMTQMLLQGAGPGYHPPNQVYAPQGVQPTTVFYPVAWVLVLILHQQDHHHQAQLQVIHHHLKKMTILPYRNYQSRCMFHDTNGDFVVMLS